MTGHINNLSLQIALEDILGNAPAKAPSDGPTVSYGMGYHGNDPDAPDDTPLHEAFEEGRERGFWEACQMLEAAMTKHGASDEELAA
jgi:hypothetical protein